MFSSAFKSFSSNITSTYEIAKQPTATAGAWTIFDAKKKTTGIQASIFVFERKLLEVQSNGFDRKASSTSVRKAQDEVIERLRKEASSLARLRHPSILQLMEPLEDTRSGGLMFATEPVLASLSGALAQMDRNERNSSRRRDNRDYAMSPASQISQDVELDELEIQKGLLQIAKGLEFLHDSAKLVHANLTPDAIFINTKSDWKISGLSFSTPPDGADGNQAAPQISLSEVLLNDSRIPPTVQLNLDYTSPDFVLDSNINFSADIFSLGLLLLACYRTPHVSPIETHGNQTTYKKIFTSLSTVPSSRNNYLCSGKLPNELEQVLPRILARRPTQRMNAAEFQQSEYFDNILVNTMRFLDGLPAKTQAEKSQFMRGLGRVMPQFPASVLSKKVLSALLDELKDRDLLSLIMENIFLILQKIPNRQDILCDKVLPRLRDIFLMKSKSEERDSSKEAGLNVLLSNIQLITENTTAKQFKDDVLPMIQVALESSTHALVDAGLYTLGIILPVLDFSTVKHDLFPVIANVFSKTSSLGIKVRGLEALGVLCGASDDKSKRTDELSGMASPQEKPKQNISTLDKYTMQEKVVPLLKGIKTKEPAVMMAALTVFQQIGKAGDIDFLAVEVMPILWTFALGPLLDLNQFKAYMETIRAMSGKIEREQIRKLQELSSSTRSEPSRTMSSTSTNQINGTSIGVEDDFEKLVLGGRGSESKDPFAGAMAEGQKLTPNPPTFSWSSNTGSTPARTMSTLQLSLPTSRSITPDVQMPAFPTLQPAHTQTSVPVPAPAPVSSPWSASTPSQSNQRLQASNYMSGFNTMTSLQTMAPSVSTNVLWPQQSIQPSGGGWSQPTQPTQSASTVNWPQSQLSTSISSPPSANFTPMLAPPPSKPPALHQQQQQQQQRQSNYSSFGTGIATPTPTPMNLSMGVLQPRQGQAVNQSQQQRVNQQQQQNQIQKSGLDKYASLL